jgi:hypothetical protein
LNGSIVREDQHEAASAHAAFSTPRDMQWSTRNETLTRLLGHAVIIDAVLYKALSQNNDSYCNR